MKRFSIGASISDAFSLTRRRPLTVFVWGLLLIAPSLAAMALIFPAMGDIFANMPVEGATDVEAEAAFDGAIFGNMVQLQMANLLSNVVQMLMMAVVYAAIMRSVLRPKETSFFSVRIGMDELRVAVVGLAVMMGLYGVMLVAVLLGAAITMAVWAIDMALGISVMVGLGLVLFVALMWGLARVSLIAPLSVLRRDFAFVEGWKLAAGKGWSLLGMMVIVMLVIIAIETVLLLAGVVALAGVRGGGEWWTDPDFNPFPQIHAWLQANWYWVALVSVAGCWIYGLVMTLSVAPFASACRQLVDSAAPQSEPEPAVVGGGDETGSPD